MPIRIPMPRGFSLKPTSATRTIERTMATKKAPITTTVLYPNSANAKLDVNYYLNTHLPMAQRIWGPLGMKSWAVTSFIPGLDGSQPKYLVETVSEWTNADAAKDAIETDEGQEVLKDMENFTNISPIILFGKESGVWRT